jgi:hypothetical protein
LVTVFTTAKYINTEYAYVNNVTIVQIVARVPVSLINAYLI